LISCLREKTESGSDIKPVGNERYLETPKNPIKTRLTFQPGGWFNNANA